MDNGYTGEGYQGGYWNGDRFDYNRAANNVNTSNVQVYNRSVTNTVINNTTTNNTTVNNVSYNGPGGVTRPPAPQELAATREQRIPPMATQVQHREQAAQNRQQFAAVNHGKPAVVAAPQPIPQGKPIAAVIPARPAPGPATRADRPAPPTQRSKMFSPIATNRPPDAPAHSRSLFLHQLSSNRIVINHLLISLRPDRQPRHPRASSKFSRKPNRRLVRSKHLRRLRTGQPRPRRRSTSNKFSRKRARSKRLRHRANQRHPRRSVSNKFSRNRVRSKRLRHRTNQRQLAAAASATSSAASAPAASPATKQTAPPPRATGSPTRKAPGRARAASGSASTTAKEKSASATREKERTTGREVMIFEFQGI